MQNEQESNESKDELRFRQYYFKPKVVKRVLNQLDS